MNRVIYSYKRKKGSPKQKRNLLSFNQFVDQLVCIYYHPLKLKEAQK